MTPALDVVVVSYRTPELLRRCLRSLERRTGANQRLIVVDNASGDGSADLVTAEFPGADLVEAPANLGFAAAANAGIAPWQRAVRSRPQPRHGGPAGDRRCAARVAGGQAEVGICG